MNAPSDPVEFALLNDFQRDFPLVPDPWHEIGDRVGLAPDAVLAAYRRLTAAGVVGRIGAVVAPRRVGSSTLAALAAPVDRLEAVAAAVGRHPGVNHNYEREHALNLWFVATATDDDALGRLLATIAVETGCRILDLPLEDGYHIDLGFNLAAPEKRSSAPVPRVAPSGACAMPEIERRLLATLADGIELGPHPFAALGHRAGIGEALTLEILSGWLADGIVKRFGVVVRHHELGYTANAMCVWDVPDDLVAGFGAGLAGEPGVTLCYRRRRALPEWQFNLFCMIHGRERTEVDGRRDEIARRLGLDDHPHAVLFSRRRFKQTAARYGEVDAAR